MLRTTIKISKLIELHRVNKPIISSTEFKDRGYEFASNKVIILLLISECLHWFLLFLSVSASYNCLTKKWTKNLNVIDLSNIFQIKHVRI